MEATALPRIGAALPIKHLEEHRDWILEGQRDLEIQDPALPSVLDADWRPLVRQAKDCLSGYSGRLGIHGPFLGFSLMAGCDRRLAEAVIGRLSQALDFAAELGATHMVLHSPFIGFGASPFSTGVLPKDLFNEKAFVGRILEGILDKAKAAKCLIVLENVEDNNSALLVDLVASLGSDQVRMSLDVGHAFIKHRLGGPTPDQWVRDAGPLLAHLHIQDSDGQTDRHWAPGDGDINWYALFQELALLDEGPRMVLELRDYKNIPRGAEYLAARGFVA